VFFVRDFIVYLNFGWCVVRGAVMVSLGCMGGVSVAWAAEADKLPSVVQDSSFSKLASAPSPQADKEHWTGSLGMGVTAQRGNTESSQGSLTAEAVRELHDSRMLANALFVRSVTRDGTKTDSGTADARAERNLSENIFGFVGAGYERDTAQGIDSRGNVSTGVGVRAFNEPRLDLNLYTGADLAAEKKVHEDAVTSGSEALFGTELRYKLSDTAHLSHRMLYYPNSVGGGGKRLIMQGELNSRLTEHFGLQLAALMKYRENPAEDHKHTDTVLFSGFTANF
jgi:putative salt-induced outer membrane protein YdiY